MRFFIFCRQTVDKSIFMKTKKSHLNDKKVAFNDKKVAFNDKKVAFDPEFALIIKELQSLKIIKNN